jgi:hypothetical protein
MEQSTRLENQPQSDTKPSQRPEWIGKLCEALADALADDRLPEPVFEALATAVDVATGEHIKHISDHARRLMPDALERAISGNQTAEYEAANQPLEVIRARSFELIDENGKVCAELRTMRGILGQGTRTIFSMGGKDCRSIQMVSDKETGEMAFRILEGGEFYPISFGVHIRPDDPRPMLEIGGSCKVGNAYMRLSVDEDMNSPSIKLYDRKDKLRAELSVSKDGSPTFEMKEKKAKEPKGGKAQDEKL